MPQRAAKPGPRNHEGVAAHFAACALTLEQPDPKFRTDRMFIVGRVIHSYGQHYAIARIVSRGVVLLNTDRYSRSTSGHCGLVADACRKAGVQVVRQSFTESDRLPVDHPLSNKRRSLELA